MKSIGRYLESRLLCGALAVLVFGCIGLTAAIAILNIREFDFALRTKANMLADLIFEHEHHVEIDFADEFLPEFERDKDPAYFQVFFTNGVVAARSARLGVNDLPARRTQHTDPILGNVLLPDGRRGRFIQLHVQPRIENRVTSKYDADWVLVPDGIDRHQPYVVLVLAWGRNQRDTTLWTIYGITIGILSVLMLVLLLLIRIFLDRGLRPLYDMNEQIRALGPTALNQRMLAAVPQELEPAQTALNSFLDNLEESIERERQFIDDVAHELRTPVAEIRLACDVGARWPDDPQMVQQRFQEMQAAAMHMENKVNGLLEVSRLQTATIPAQHTQIEIASFARTLWEQTVETFNPHNLQLDLRVNPTLTIESDAAQLEMILLNLFRNALSYSEDRSIVDFTANTLLTGGIELVLGNKTTELSEADLPQIFDRFWRKNTSEANCASLGLGLSIVQALSTRLGIEVSTQLATPDRFIFNLFFPAGTRSAVHIQA